MKKIDLEYFNCTLGKNFLNQNKNLEVLIWSSQHKAYWRAGRNGYTHNIKEAGIYTLQDAYNATSHCGPEKQISFALFDKKDPDDFRLLVTTYNLEIIKKQVIAECIKNNPRSPIEVIAEKTGLSKRTLYRYGVTSTKHHGCLIENTCSHKNIASSDGCDNCLDCGETNY